MVNKKLFSLCWAEGGARELHNNIISQWTQSISFVTKAFCEENVSFFHISFYGVSWLQQNDVENFLKDKIKHWQLFITIQIDWKKYLYFVCLKANKLELQRYWHLRWKASNLCLFSSPFAPISSNSITSFVFFQEDQDWGIVAMVLDRMFLWVFGAAAVVGSAMILTESPSLFDPIQPIDSLITTIGMDQPPPQS